MRILSITFVFLFSMFFSSNVFASESFQLPEWENGQQIQELRVPELGTTRQSRQKSVTSFQAGMDLGVLHQSSSGYAALAYFLLAVMITSIITGVTELIGTVFNIVGLAKSKGNLGWGIATTALSSLILIMYLTAIISNPPKGDGGFWTGTIIVLSTQLPVLVLGIFSIRTFIVHKKRSAQKKKTMAFHPWLNVSQEGHLRGGLALSGTF